MRTFLDAVMLVLAWNGAAKNKIALWHKTLALYGRITDFSLNPRLQLEDFADGEVEVEAEQCSSLSFRGEAEESFPRLEAKMLRFAQHDGKIGFF